MTDRDEQSDSPNTHHARYATYPHETMRWIREHGYHAAITGVGLGPGCLSLIIQRGDEPPIIANLPAHLDWDGERITVRRKERP